MSQNCPQYAFPHPCKYTSTIPAGAKVITCSGIAPATHPGDTDCDFELEFTIEPRSSQQVYISASAQKERLVLSSGALAYRRSGNRIYVLVGGMRWKWTGCNYSRCVAWVG